jgi:hypothetical protein
VTVEILITFAVVFGVLLLLTTTSYDTDVVLVGAMVVLTLTGILEPDQALQGFASSGVMTIAACTSWWRGCAKRGPWPGFRARCWAVQKTSP